MEQIEIVGQVIAGKIAHILVREKAGEKLEMGNLLVTDGRDGSLLILQIHNLIYGSQVPQIVRELTAGLELEGHGGSLDYLDPNLRNYIIAETRAVVQVSASGVKLPKALPGFFSSVRHITDDDLQFLQAPENTVYLGKVRSGSNILNVDVKLDATALFTHHVLIPATTGRGKSNLVKVLLWSIVDDDSIGVLVLDPHDEYYGKRTGKEVGLIRHPSERDKVEYYSVNPPPGAHTLIINLKSIMPWHIEEAISLNDTQTDALYAYYMDHKGDDQEWIKAIVRGEGASGVYDKTLSVLQRKFRTMLGLEVNEQGALLCNNKAFSDSAGESTIKQIVQALEDGKIVIIDTSRLTDKAELLIGSLVIEQVLAQYQAYKGEGDRESKVKFDEKPVISIVIEEAPRVLSAEALARQGDNIYSTVAREGWKFKVGLVAITQLTSVIPTTVLANINTKIIFGNEMASERHAIISSAAQDLSEDYVTIGSLDKGEAIVSSIFTKFAIPIQTPLFEDYVQQYLEHTESRQDGKRKRDVGKSEQIVIF
ncbi:MAG: ATP-binding protein [Halobacteriota archaeon]